MTAPRFIPYRNEGGANFVKWCEDNPAAALRRYQVRDTGADDIAATTNTSEEERRATFEVLVAYPKNGRYGELGALDREDVMRTDQLQLELVFGPLGGADFAYPYPDACWRSMKIRRERGAGVDFLAITVEFSYILAIGGAVVAVDQVTNLPTTIRAIRDQVRALVTALVAPSLSSDRFVEYRYEGPGVFRAWAEANPSAAFRRWEVRDTGADDGVSMQNSDLESRKVTFELVVAYPQDERAGRFNALSRDDVAREDRLLIARTIGVEGYGSFTGASNPNATIIETKIARELGAGVDFVVITVTYAYRRALHG